MTALHTLPGCQAATTTDNMKSIGLEMTVTNGTFTLRDPDTAAEIYGIYDRGICSIFIDRSVGNWHELLKKIDDFKQLEMYSDAFQDLWFHSNWNEEETLMKMQEEVQRVRKELGLKEVHS